MKNTILSVQGLRVEFGTGPSRKLAVNNVSFDLATGETLGLVGESGCGKSVTAAAILGILRRSTAMVTAEKIQLGSRDLSRLSESSMRAVRGREISMIFQDPATAMDPVFTVGQQLRHVINRHRPMEARAANTLSHEILERMKIPDPARTLKSYPHQLSGGMRQRAMVAMALACRPRVLLADEPTSALDVTTQASVLEQLTELAREFGTSILLITHGLGVVASTCDRCLVMYEGQIVENAGVDDLLSKPSHPYSSRLLAAVPRIISYKGTASSETVKAFHHE